MQQPKLLGSDAIHSMTEVIMSVWVPSVGHFTINECILYMCSTKNTGPINLRCMQRAMELPLIAEIKG